MTYQEADAKLQGRNRASRKLQNNTYLVRRNGWSENDIAIRLHATDVVILHKNGDMTLNTGGWNTVTTKDRINSYAQGYRIGTDSKKYADNLLLYKHGWTPICTMRGNSITIKADGTIEGGGKLEDAHEEALQIARERGKLSRWLARARGLKRDRSQCAQTWCRCHPSGFRRRTLQLGKCDSCGCNVTRDTAKHKLTIQKIMDEENTSVRLAMMHVYGFAKFMEDAHAKTLDSHGDYALLSLPLGRWQDVKALKMVCPSTGEVHISPVAPFLEKVPQALDWYFQTTDYLGKVTQQS